MTIAPGTRLGPYEILSLAGSGGMGDVYKARDTRLDRTVAIKVLPQDFALDDDRRQRFEREARVVASLSHPHICALHDIGSEPSTGSGEPSRAYLVMEYLEGETLADRLARGALPLADVIRYGSDIATALHAAHRQHIVHRDLKPGNIMITRSGVKLLDFGLAKAADPLFAASDALETRALTNVSTPGTVVGTVPYMAPEQVQGQPADWRSDIFALGAVLYEMATGQRAFSGTSPAAVASSILTSYPPPVTASPALDRIVRTCLEKDPEHRWQSAHDVALQLRALGDRDGRSEPAPVARTTAWLPWTITAAAVIAALAALGWRAQSGTQASSSAAMHEPVSFPLPPQPGGAFVQTVEAPSVAVSPDGRHIAYVARVAGARQGGQRLWVRSLGSLESRALDGTDGATSMFWSPDSRALGFFSGGKLKRVDIAGGGIVTICDARQDIGQTGTWGADNRILFANVEGGAIFGVATSGGTVEEVRKPDKSRHETRLTWPLFLPDGRRYLYLAHFPDESGAVMLAGPGGTPREVLRLKTSAQYVEPGYLLFAQDSALVARRFDVESGMLSGDPIAIDNSINYAGSTGLMPLSASRNGVLAYQSHRDISRLASFDRTGRELETMRPPGGYQTVQVSPDGRQLVFDRVDPRTATYDLWSLDLDRGAEARLTSEPGAESFPIWAARGTLIHAATRGAPPRLFRRTISTGKDEELFPPGLGMQRPNSVSPQGDLLLYSQRTSRGNFDLMLRPLPDGPATAFRDSPADEFDGRIAPGGRLVAYVSDESGRNEVHVAPFPSRGTGTPVSTGGGVMPRWRRDGTQLFYVSSEGDVMAVPVRSTPGLEIGKPVRQFSQAPGSRWAEYDVAPDGRFFAVVRMQSAAQQPMTVIVNWPASLSR